MTCLEPRLGAIGAHEERNPPSRRELERSRSLRNPVKRPVRLCVTAMPQKLLWAIRRRQRRPALHELFQFSLGLFS